MENYHVIELVGEGSFGKVYKGRRRNTGQITAMKFIVKHGKSENEIKNLRQEIEILRTLKHENIIQMLDTFETRTEFCVVTEFAQGELFEILEDDKTLPEAIVQQIAKQLVRALHYLHHNRIIHRDMKPQNILVGSGGSLKLCDFGFARHMSSKTMMLTSIKGTPLYMAPELVQERKYNRTVDLWSLGVILYELYVGQTPFYTNNIVTLISHIARMPVQFPRTASPAFKDLLKGLLNKKAENRLDWPDLLDHPFVRESEEERLSREDRLACAARRAADSCAWKGENGAVAGAAVYAASKSGTPGRDAATPVRHFSAASPAIGARVRKSVLTQRNVLDGPAPQAAAAPGALKGSKAGASLQTEGPGGPPGRTGNDRDACGERFSDGVKGRRSSSSTTPDGAATAAAGPGAADDERVSALLGRVEAADSCAAASDVCADSEALSTLLALLRAPQSAQATSRWALSPTLKRAISAAGRLLRLQPAGERATDVQRAVSKVASIMLTIQPAAHGTAVHVIHVLQAAEAAAARQPASDGGAAFLAFPDTYTLYAALLNAGNIPTGDAEGPWEVIAAAASALGAVVQRLNACICRTASEATLKVADSVLSHLQHDLSANLCRVIDAAGATSGDASRARAQAAVEALKRGAAATLGRPLDMSTHVYMQRRLLAQTLLASRSATGMLLRALRASDAERSAALVVLMHTARLSSQFAAELAEAGLVKRLLSQAHAVGMPTLDKARMYRIVHSIVEHARVLIGTESGSKGSRAGELRASLLLDSAPAQLVDDLDASAACPMLCSTVLAALASYCDLLNCARPAHGLPALPRVVYSSATIDTVRALLKQAPGVEPAMAPVDGAPCRIGLLDPVACFTYALAVGPTVEGAPAWAGGAPAPAGVAQSVGSAAAPLVADFVTSIAAADRALLELSPLGVRRAVDALAVIANTGDAVPDHAATPGLLTDRDVLRLVVALLGQDHLQAVLLWPMYSGGNRKGVSDVVTSTSGLLYVPFATADNAPSRSASAAAQAAQPQQLERVRALHKRPAACLAVQEAFVDVKVPRMLANVMEAVAAPDCHIPLALMVKMLLDANSKRTERVASQYIAAGGMQPAFLQKLLRDSNPENVLVKALLLVSQLARMAKSSRECPSTNYGVIHQADIYSAVRKLAEHGNPNVRMRACNLVGNLCRHSAYFYQYIGQYDLLGPIIQLCSDSDSATRKFACFAVGNAAFHNDSLYSRLGAAVPRLVPLLRDPESKTRVNASGALGNFVRNGPQLIPQIIQTGTVAGLMAMATGTPASDGDRQPQIIALFSLGNLANHRALYDEFARADAHARVQALCESDHPEVRKNAVRLRTKLTEIRPAQAVSGTAGNRGGPSQQDPRPGPEMA